MKLDCAFETIIINTRNFKNATILQFFQQILTY